MVGMKFKIGGQSPEKDAQRLRVAKSIVGDDFLFVVDANQGYSVAEALNFLSLIEDDVALRWFEEPTRWHADWRGLRDVRLRGNVNVAAGQSEISRVGMREMMLNGAIDVSNYDASWGGGPTEWRRVAAIAQVFEVQLGHHEEAQVASNLLASVPHGTFVESFSPTRDPISTGTCSQTDLRSWMANFRSRPARGSGGSLKRTSSRNTAQTSRHFFLFLSRKQVGMTM